MNYHTLPFEETTVRDRAPGLTVESLNAQLKDAWVAGYWGGKDVGQRVGWDEGYARGREDATEEIRERITEVINRRLNHVVRRLTETAQRRKKTTIADEREWMAASAADTEAAIGELRRAAA
jgi:flagellar biosynthesis/type III secretory pathway protein FliH